MKYYSRKQLALATLALLKKHTHKDVVHVLAEILIKEKRTNEVDIIVREIGNQLLQKHGELTGTVESAHVLSEKNTQDINHLLKKVTNAKTIFLKHRINKMIIGGFKVSTPTLEIDATLARPLHQLKLINS